MDVLIVHCLSQASDLPVAGAQHLVEIGDLPITFGYDLTQAQYRQELIPPTCKKLLCRTAGYSLLYLSFKCDIAGIIIILQSQANSR